MMLSISHDTTMLLLVIGGNILVISLCGGIITGIIDYTKRPEKNAFLEHWLGFSRFYFSILSVVGFSLLLFGVIFM